MRDDEAKDRVASRFRDENGDRDGEDSGQDVGGSEDDRGADVSELSPSELIEEWQEETVRERENVNLYIPEEVVSEMKKRYAELNQKFVEEHGEELEKNSAFYPVVLLCGLESDELEERLGLR